MVPRRVDRDAVAGVVTRWTGIPVGRMLASDIDSVLSLEAALRQRVIGQDHALRAIADAVQISRASLSDPRKPVGVFLLVGTSGVGKTETAVALAEQLYGGPQSLTTVNLSEFKEEHKVSMLVGSPPGYVGYGEGGVLTEAVRRRPHGVLLLDEVEKAHPGVQDVFYQVFDRGILRDGEGRDIDFRHTTILLTANVGSDLIASLAADPETMPDAAGLESVLRPELLKVFKPAFLGRVVVVPYLPLSTMKHSPESRAHAARPGACPCRRDLRRATHFRSGELVDRCRFARARHGNRRARRRTDDFAGAAAAALAPFPRAARRRCAHQPAARVARRRRAFCFDTNRSGPNPGTFVRGTRRTCGGKRLTPAPQARRSRRDMCATDRPI